MKHLLYACVIALLVAMSGGFAATSTLAQSDALPPEGLLLTLEEDQQWMFTGPEGDKNVSEVVVVQDGEPQAKLSPVAEARLKEHNVQSVYGYRAQIRQVDNVYETIATGVEMQVLVFGNANDASAYQEGYFDAIYQDDVVNNDGARQLQLMEQLPDSPYPTVGMTFSDPYFDRDGNTIGNASALRLVAQNEFTLVSVRVVGPFVDFNFDFAHALMDNQMACVEQNILCEPVTISEITPAWSFLMGTLFYANDADEALSARFVFPVEEPVREPQMGTIFDAGSNASQSAPESGTSTRTTRTTRTTSSGDSSGTTRVTRTPRTSTSGETSGTTRTVRTSTTATTTEAPPANATVIAATADVFAEPDMGSDVLVSLVQEDRIAVTGAPETVDGVVWVPVITETGEEGWMLAADLWKD